MKDQSCTDSSKVRASNYLKIMTVASEDADAGALADVLLSPDGQIGKLTQCDSKDEDLIQMAENYMNINRAKRERQEAYEQ